MLKLLLLSFATLAGGIAMAQSTDVTIRNKATIEAAFDAWRAGTGNPFDLLANDATWTIVGHSVASKRYPDKTTFLAEVIQPFNARMSKGLAPTRIRGLHADGTTVVIFFDASATARDGKSYDNTYAWFMDMKDGKIVRVSAFYDSIVFNDLWSRVTPAP
jgi:ketosteroid isomerase-like protein